MILGKLDNAKGEKRLKKNGHNIFEPKSEPTFCAGLCLIQVKFRLQIVECFQYHFLIVREHM